MKNILLLAGVFIEMSIGYRFILKFGDFFDEIRKEEMRSLTERVYNFSAGPAILPDSVLRQAANEMLNYHGSGQSVMEMSHRSTVFQNIIDETEVLLRELLNVPDNYKILFLQGGGSTQFSMVPLNLKQYGKADYIISGQWAQKAATEAKKFFEVREILSGTGFSRVPDLENVKFSENIDYVYICQNNTIYGTHFSDSKIPSLGNVPLVCDASSCLLSEPVDISKYGLIFAGAQKNMGPAGVTIVILRDDLIKEVPDSVPTMLSYKVHAEHGSMYNTPPCYAIYIVKLVLEWLKNEVGGIQEIYKLNKAKAGKLYEFLDNSNLFMGTAEKDSRSLMNVTFVTGNEALDSKFVMEAANVGLVNLKGHRSVGGMRASLYNAMPMEGVDALINFMKKFEKQNG